ncbi:MAG: AAA family ATPase [Gemmatimonadaceae bacterium]|nr:AAA family ATPase [Gemmatimonadaceae bacterium]
MSASSGAGVKPGPIAALPLVGRRSDVASLRLALDDVMDGGGRVASMRGVSGVGKSRLVDVLVSEARARGMVTAVGRGYAVEAGRPFGMWSDALTPLLAALGSGPSAVLARGAEWELSSIVPAFGTRAPAHAASGGDADGRGRLFWNFARFLDRLSQREPLVLVFDDAHYADTSSLELLHFVGRQLEAERLLLAYTYVPDDRMAERVQEVDRSLAGRPRTVRRELSPLTRQDVSDMLHGVFGPDVPAAFVDSLHERTGGLPFFIDETLKALIEAGTLGVGPAGWKGFVTPMDGEIPQSVRAMVRARLAGYASDVLQVADVVALAGPRATLDVIESVTGLAVSALADALDALCARQILCAPTIGGGPYVFAQHIVRMTVAEGISEARGRALHRALATSIERYAGPDAAADVALHLANGGLAATPASIPHLIRAGRDALARRADPEAAAWLRDALAVADRQPEPVLDPLEVIRLLEDAALATQRAGNAPEARRLLLRARDAADAAGNHEARAEVRRRTANAFVIEGRVDRALEEFAEAERAARLAARPDLVVRVRVATAMALQSIGRSADGARLLEEVVDDVEREGNPLLRARVHRALVLIYGWTGPIAKVEHHSARALEASRVAGDEEVAWSVHWALATLAGLHGDGEGIALHRREAERLANLLHSPPLQAATAEVAIEHASISGEWQEALETARTTIPLARAVAPHTLLPRILVWTGLVHLGRDQLHEATRLLDEAWGLSGADRAGEALPANVHNLVLAHTGRAALHLHRGEWREALAMGERGLELADRYGYVAWAIHRLLPQSAEAALWLQDFTRAEAVGRRLRAESRSLDHRLGVAWADAIDALIARLRDHRRDASERLLAAADDLEAIPFPFHAARLRRNAAQVLELDGRLEDAVRQLRHAHDTFVRLGAEFELRGTRSQLRSLGVRLPPRQVMEGAGALTGRELEIARCVSRRRSNKDIARELDISSRTVSTHLSNIFGKLGVDSRGALADLIREHPTLAGLGTTATPAESSRRADSPVR